MLAEIRDGDLLEPRGIYGFWPARAEGDDIHLDGVRLPMLRQQADFGDSRPNRSLADYVAPAENDLDDHVGAFAVGIHGADELADAYAADGDDYRAITVKALADRLAEAFAEWLHERARTSGTTRESAWWARISFASASAASGLPSATRRAPITPRSAPCSACSTPLVPASG